MPARASSGVLAGPPPENGMKARNARPITARPIPNFSGVPGWREPSLVHMLAKTAAKMMMKIGLIDWTKLGGISQPKISRFREVSA